MLKTSSALLLTILLLPGVSSCKQARSNEGKGLSSERTTDRLAIVNEMEEVLTTGMMDLWYPRCVDKESGGYLSNFDKEWNQKERQPKFIVTQARHTWASAQMYKLYPDKELFREVSEHGYIFLREKMWDKEFGGYYTLTDREGNVAAMDGSSSTKIAYGNAFAIYGLAAYFQVSNDSSALDLAIKSFHWLDKHSHDPEFGGYFQFLERDGTPMIEGQNGTPPKDQNSSIHIIEGFTELYKVWKDDHLKSRIHEMLVLIRDTITTEKGYMNLFFHRDWTPVLVGDEVYPGNRNKHQFDYISFGHDIETAYLLLEASEAIGLEHDKTTHRVSKTMTDHTIQNGWDSETGAIYESGFYFEGQEDMSVLEKYTQWWAATESFHTMLLMSGLYPDDPMDYYDKFTLTWDYCKNNLIDQERGGWYRLGINESPESANGDKGGIWKGNYHNARSLINCMKLLRKTGWPEAYGQQSHEPVNKDASPEAKALLGYLYNISGKKIISGHHNGSRNMNQWHSYVEELTGKSPAVWGSDFINYFREGNPERIIEEAIKRHQDGYIVTLMWHTGRPQDDPPFDWSTSTQGEMSVKEWEELTTPGTPLHSKWMARADTIAGYLAQIRDQNIPVLWRPYHEMNGIWFWWGDKKGEEGFAKLWRMMYDRYVNHHHLNNLIWVWNTNTPRDREDDEAYAYELYFPGLKYVDVLAADVYHNDYRQVHHDQLLELAQGKVISLGEVGEAPTPEILDNQPMWTWFMIWSRWVKTHNTPDKVKDLYSYPRTLSHDETHIKY